MLFLIFTIIFQLWTENTKAQKFRMDYMWAQGFQTFYSLHDMATNWDKAMQICEAEGTTLLKPESLEEVENLKILMSNMRDHYSAVFVGLHDKFSDGDFITLKGEPIQGTYLELLWAPGSPNNLTDNSTEHCVVMSREGMLDDRPCQFIYPFICKIFANETKYNEECHSYDADYQLQDNGKCYKYHSEPLTWHDAYMICNVEEGNLVIINSDEEANLITGFMSKYLINKAPNPNILHLGFSDLMFPFEYRTINGQTLEQANFSTWSPLVDNIDEMRAKRCGALSREGHLIMTWCDIPAMFICEKIVNGTSVPTTDVTTATTTTTNKPDKP